jgi:anti-sigma factor RsiW
MTHLSDTELLDFIDGTLTPARAAHLAACDSCRRQADELRATMRAVSSVDVPEPSPLFWDHFSARVRQGIDPDTSPGVAWWRRPSIVFACAAGITVLAVVTARLLPGGPHATPTVVSAPASPIPTVSNAAAAISASPPSDPEWRVLTAAASDLRIDEASAAGLAVRPGSIESAVLDLTPVERGELERLLREELRRAGA